jgi:hypothetical protein
VPGKATLERRLGVVEEGIGNLEKATVEQGKVVANIGAKVKTLESQANEMPSALATNLDQIWANQKTLQEAINMTAWKVDKLLHVLYPEDYPDPGDPPLNEEAHAEARSDKEGEARPATAEGSQPREEGGPSAVSDVR